MLTRLPGLIDIHVHLRDLGQEHKEDFFTGTSAALAGGFTTVIDMPNKQEPIFSKTVLDNAIAVAREKVVSDLGFYFGSMGENIEEFALVDSSVMGIKLYMDMTTGGLVIPKERAEAVFQAWPGNTPILTHAEGEMVNSVIEFATRYNKRVHIVHVSSKEELEQIIAAKERGAPVTCGVCAHHLFLTENDVPHLGTYGLMKPQLKKQSDVDFLWKNLHTIDVMESDHAPHTKEEKASDTPPFGVPGLETTLPLLLRAEAEGRITREKIISLAFEQPSRIFGIQQSSDTYIEIDETAEYYIDPSTLKTKCGWTPFTDIKMKGRVERVTLRGATVFEDGEVVASPGSGRILKPMV